MNHRKIYARSGVFAWSGSGISAGGVSGLVVAEAAQQIDLFRDSVSSFFDFLSTDDIISSDSATSLQPTRSVAAEFKFNDLAWAPFRTEEHPAGLIVGCGESGHTSVFDAAALQGGKLQCLGVRSYHQGHVLSVSVNTVNPKWVCTGGAMGSVLLWDMNKPLEAVTPGKSNFEHQIKFVCWNRYSEHLLGSLTSERCSIWDLRSPGAPALDIADIGGGVEWSTMKWSPVCGTELCMASQNDQNPMLYKWDLRYPSSAVLGYRLHSRGIFAMDWCPKDPDILVTTGKDEQMIFQNPNTQQVIGQVKATGWARKLSWCNTNPNLFAVSYYDHPVTVYSITPFASSAQNNELLEGAHFELSVIPAWSRPGPCGVSFSTGNRICIFSKENVPNTSSSQPLLTLGRVKGDQNISVWVSKLLSALERNQLGEYCTEMSDSFTSKPDPYLELIWTFLSNRALNSSRSAYLSKLESLFPTKVEDHNADAQSIIEKMKAWCLSSTKQLNDDDNVAAGDVEKEVTKQDQNEDQCIFANLISASDVSKDKVNLLNIVCGSSYMEGVAAALSEKSYLFALLLAYTANDANVLTFVGRSIASDPSVDVTTRVVALMAARMWDELLASWDVRDWHSLFRLILTQAPPETAAFLCRKLALKMQSGNLGLCAAIPAIAGSDVECLLSATEKLTLQERMSLANILRQSIGGGSLRIASSGPNYIATLNSCVTELEREGFIEEAWKLLEPIDVTNCEKQDLKALKFVLYEALGRPANSSIPEDPYSVTRAEYSNLGSAAAPEMTNVYRSLKQPGYRSVDETRYAASSNQYSTNFQNVQPSGYNMYSPTAYNRYPNLPGSMQAASQVSQQSFHPASLYSSQPMVTGYTQTGYCNQMAPAQNGMYSAPFSQTPQSSIPSQNLYSSPVSVPPPMMMQSTGDSFTSYPGRTRTVSSSSYSSGYYPRYAQDTSAGSATSGAGFQQTKQQSFSPTGNPTSGVGWNDPPPLALKKSSAPATVAEIKWTPATFEEQTPPLTEKKPVMPSSQSYSLNEADSYLIGVLNATIANIRKVDSTPVMGHRTADIEQRISSELIPRLSRSCFSQETWQLLQEFARSLSVYDFSSCQAISSRLVGGTDFVELSPIMPGLRALLQLAQRTLLQHR